MKKALLFLPIILFSLNLLSASAPQLTTPSKVETVKTLEQRIDSLNLSLEEKLQLKFNLDKNTALRNQILKLIETNKSSKNELMMMEFNKICETIIILTSLVCSTVVACTYLSPNKCLTCLLNVK